MTAYEVYFYRYNKIVPENIVETEAAVLPILPYLFDLRNPSVQEVWRSKGRLFNY